MSADHILQDLRVESYAPISIPLHGLHAMMLKHVEESFRKNGECLPCFAIAVRTDVHWLDVLWADLDERLRCFAAITDYMKVMRASAYSFASECYTAALPLVDGKVPDDIPMPSEMEHDEIAMVSSYGADGANFFSQYLITPASRPGSKAFIGPRVDNPYGGGEAEGNAMNLFAKPSRFDAARYRVLAKGERFYKGDDLDAAVKAFASRLEQLGDVVIDDGRHVITHEPVIGARDPASGRLLVAMYGVPWKEWEQRR